MNAVWLHLPILQVVIPLFGALLAGLLRRAGPAFAVALVVRINEAYGSIEEEEIVEKDRAP